MEHQHQKAGDASQFVNAPGVHDLDSLICHRSELANMVNITINAAVANKLTDLSSLLRQSAYFPRPNESFKHTAASSAPFSLNRLMY